LNPHLKWFAFTALVVASLPAFPQAIAKPEAPPILSESSPWILTPLLTSNPKLGLTLGGLGGYLHQFDEKSRPSIFAITAQFTNTGSIVAGALARASFDEDRQRLIAGFAYGNIKNDYADYLGTGVPLQNEAELRAFIARYLYRVKGDWFVGAQAIAQNFAVAGLTEFDNLVLDILGVVPFKAAGAGLVLQKDSRDDENMPTRGLLLNFNNMAYRDHFGSDDDYDVYRVDVRYFRSFGERNVLALRQLNHLTDGAPTASRAPVQLRGYKIGQYSGKYMSSIEGEGRFRLAEKWTATLFAGVACIYGDGQSCSESRNIFPAVGAGVQYVIKPQAGLVMNLEYAQGKDSNRGIFLKVGYAY
jgi:outer membrane protein assembly factor BamA